MASRTIFDLGIGISLGSPPQLVSIKILQNLSVVYDGSFASGHFPTFVVILFLFCCLTASFSTWILRSRSANSALHSSISFFAALFEGSVLSTCLENNFAYELKTPAFIRDTNHLLIQRGEQFCDNFQLI